MFPLTIAACNAVAVPNDLAIFQNDFLRYLAPPIYFLVACYCILLFVPVLIFLLCTVEFLVIWLDSTFLSDFQF